MTNSRFILLLSFSFHALGSPFQLPSNGIRHYPKTSRPRPLAMAMSSSDSPPDDDDDDGGLPLSDDFDDVAVTKDETILRINFSFDEDGGGSALAAVQRYTNSFPFAAVLPVQPLTYLPGEDRAIFFSSQLKKSDGGNAAAGIAWSTRRTERFLKSR